MIKIISTSQLRIGMHVTDLKAGWLSHPFATNQFMVKSENDLLNVIRTGVESLEIDTSKGLDVVTESALHQSDVIEALVETPSPLSGVKNEMKAAKVAYDEAESVITELMASARIGENISMESVNPVINTLCDSILRNHNALLALSRIRNMDKYTFEHSVSFCVLIMAFAKNLGKPKNFIRMIGIGGLLHDIGKSIVPISILNKPGKLTATEFETIQLHVAHGRKISAEIDGISQASMDVISMHHEKYDGKGYPMGLKGVQISLPGQMAAVVDVYDALTTDRCYHQARSPGETLKFLLNGGGTHFNPVLVQQFIKFVVIYPAGCLVLLSNDALATVIEVTSNMLNPIVEVFYDTADAHYITAKLIDLRDFPELSIKNIERDDKWVSIVKPFFTDGD